MLYNENHQLEHPLSTGVLMAARSAETLGDERRYKVCPSFSFQHLQSKASFSSISYPHPAHPTPPTSHCIPVCAPVASALLSVYAVFPSPLTGSFL